MRLGLRVSARHSREAGRATKLASAAQLAFSGRPRAPQAAPQQETLIVAAKGPACDLTLSEFPRLARLDRGGDTHHPINDALLNGLALLEEGMP